MPTYLVANRVPPGFTPSAEGFAAWNAWFERLGDHLVDRGNPAFTAISVGACETDTALGGYTLITAESLDAATALVADHPLVSRGGGLEVAELTVLNQGRSLVGEQPA